MFVHFPTGTKPTGCRIIAGNERLWSCSSDWAEKMKRRQVRANRFEDLGRTVPALAAASCEKQMNAFFCCCCCNYFYSFVAICPYRVIGDNNNNNTYGGTKNLTVTPAPDSSCADGKSSRRASKKQHPLIWWNRDRTFTCVWRQPGTTHLLPDSTPRVKRQLNEARFSENLIWRDHDLSLGQRFPSWQDNDPKHKGKARQDRSGRAQRSSADLLEPRYLPKKIHKRRGNWPTTIPTRLSLRRICRNERQNPQIQVGKACGRVPKETGGCSCSQKVFNFTLTTGFMDLKRSLIYQSLAQWFVWCFMEFYSCYSDLFCVRKEVSDDFFIKHLSLSQNWAALRH